MKTALSITLLLITVALSSCNREKAIDPVNLNNLNGTWRLVQPVSNYSPTLVLEQQVPPVTAFTAIQVSKAGGKAAVNGYSTHLSIPSNPSHDVSVGEILTTLISGSTEAMQFERTYLASLQAVNRFELTNQNRLRLFYKGPQPGVLVYEKAP